MQCLKNALSQLPVDSGDTHQFFYAGLTNTLQAAEVCQQGSASACSDTWDIFEDRVHHGLLATAAVAGDGETVGLVPDLLHQV